MLYSHCIARSRLDHDEHKTLALRGDRSQTGFSHSLATCRYLLRRLRKKVCTRFTLLDHLWVTLTVCTDLTVPSSRCFDFRLAVLQLYDGGTFSPRNRTHPRSSQYIRRRTRDERVVCSLTSPLSCRRSAVDEDPVRLIYKGSIELTAPRTSEIAARDPAGVRVSPTDLVAKAKPEEDGLDGVLHDCLTLGDL